MKFRGLIYSGCAGAMLMGCCSCADLMLSGGDLFFDDPYTPAPPILYSPPLPSLGWGINVSPSYYPGWSGPGWNAPIYYPTPNPVKPVPPQSGNTPPQQNRPPQQSSTGQRPGANIIFGDGGSSGGNTGIGAGSTQNRPSGGANGRH